MTKALKGYMKRILSPLVTVDRCKESGLPILVNEATTPSDSRASVTYKQSQTKQSDSIKLLLRESHHFNKKQHNANANWRYRRMLALTM